MTRQYWCPNCGQNIESEQKWSWPWLILLLLLGIIPGLIYYFVLKDKECCPRCGTPVDRLQPPSPPRA